MNIFQLRYFVSVAQLENISKAADLLHLSQSSLSKNIAKLEAELGMPLFDRRGKKITLNEQGRRFWDFSSLVLRELELTIDDMNVLAKGFGNKLRIGLSGNNSLIISCLQQFVAAYPQTELNVTGNIEQLEQIDINNYDMLIYPEDIKYAKFQGYRLGNKKYLLAVNKDNPLAALQQVALEDLGQDPFAFIAAGSYVEHAYRLCVALNVPLNTQFFTDSPEYHRQMIAANQVVGFVLEDCTAAYEADANICLLPLEDPRFSREMMVCFKREKHLTEIGLAFKRHALEFLHLPPEGMAEQ